MSSGASVQQLMPLMREFGALERKRLGDGVTPLEYQRWLDLKDQMGQRFAPTRRAGLAAIGASPQRDRPARLVVAYRDREALLAAIVDEVRPAGLFVPTPFAAEVGTDFLLRIVLDREADSADLAATVVSSIVQGANTLSTMSMGMALKLDRPERAQRTAVSRLFVGALDERLGLDA